MRRRTVLALTAQVPVLLAGCSSSDGNGDGTDAPTAEPTSTEAPEETETETATPEPQPDLSHSIDWPAGGVTGDPLTVVVTVDNAGDGAGDFDATLSAGGEDRDSASVTVDPDGTETLTFETTPDSTGSVDLTVAGETETLTVHDHELQFVDAAMADVDSVRIEQTASETGQIDLGEGPTAWEKTASATIEKDFVASTLYEESEEDLVYGGTDLEETIEHWIVDGTQYQRTTKHTENEVEYASGSTSEPNRWSALDIHGTDTESFLGFEHTTDEYVFVFDPGTSDGATALLSRVIGQGGFLPAENATEARLELRYDRRSGRTTTFEYDLTIDDASTFPHLERTETNDYVEYGVAVDVSVPQEVRDNTS